MTTTERIFNSTTGDTFDVRVVDGKAFSVTLSGIRPYPGAFQKQTYQPIDATDPRYAEMITEGERRYENRRAFAVLVNKQRGWK